MLPDRELLDTIDPSKLKGRVLNVSWNDESRNYTLINSIGRGQTAVAWRAESSFNRSFAIKFVPKSEFRGHSLHAEAERASKLDPALFAQIDYYGDPHCKLSGVDLSPFYALVVDWVEGATLEEYLQGSQNIIDGATFCNFARDLCGVLHQLNTSSPALTHNDLHERNILISPKRAALANSPSQSLVVIDTGQLKTIDRREQLTDGWHRQIDAYDALGNLNAEQVVVVNKIRERLSWFARTDQEWVVCHLCALYNKMARRYGPLSPADKRFLRDLPALLRSMIDPDRSRRLDDPSRMNQEIQSLWLASTHTGPPPMTTPFDLPSAELIRSDRQLMDLFSEEYPRIDACRSNAPVYIYGPRGSGKSTILRSLSIKALLASVSPKDAIDKIPFLGIYLSSSQELRSRFLLMSDEDFASLEGHLVRYFNLLLVEALVDSLDAVFQSSTAATGNGNHPLIPMPAIAASECCGVIRARLGIDSASARYAGTSELTLLKHEIQRSRDDLWAKILDKSIPATRPDAQLVFDIVKDLESRWPLLSSRRIVFLIDDYSNQRIPRALQKRLNQAITFSKQGSPLFKVTSEYDGVDLEGVQEGREVTEVNVGFEYIKLSGTRRYQFLQNVLEKRFRYCNAPIDITEILPLSKISPVIPMASAIRAAASRGGKFFYYGLDTISDLCSGDFAMGIDVVRRIFENSNTKWNAPTEISPQKQDDAIREYSRQEFEFIRHQSRRGRQKFDIADRLCWLAKECILTRDVTKDNERVPMVKSHLDISETAYKHLEADYPENAELLDELVRTGVLFPLQSSRSRDNHDATRRYMIRRILLARHTCALGRHIPIRIDDVQRLVWFLTEPNEFVESELSASIAQASDSDEEERGSAVKSPAASDKQLKITWPVEDAVDG